MKQIAQYQDGRHEVREVPMPMPPPGGVLVRTTHSVISAGTEKMKVMQASMNLIQKARARPDQVRKVLDTARNLGWRSALQKVRNRLESPAPLGYSAAGVVVDLDKANTRFRVGDRVACAGAECAFHAEYLAMPDLLLAPVPDEVENWRAAYTTICAIALHAVRQTAPNLGDRVLVTGQGLVGLLVTNMLALAGARVIAVDVQTSRRPISAAMGAERVVILGAQRLLDEVRDWTQGYGVDAAVICAASNSSAPVEQAAEALRDRGRVVSVGMTRMDLPWRIFYEKELDVRFSRSYGPGRYDATYEWAGCDYPIGYVRWTEQRNFEACLNLMARGRINLEAITTRRVAFLDAAKVYEDLKKGSSDIGVVLEYSTDERTLAQSSGPTTLPADPSPITAHPVARLTQPVTSLNVIGAGNFARTMLLPHLKGRISFGTVVNQTALSATHVKTKFGFQRAATDVSDAFTAGTSSAVLIATRHHLHAPLVKTALLAHRHVFVEKPLCLTPNELQEIDAALSHSHGSLQVGFNRRFAPATVELKRRLADTPGPKTAVYRVLPGPLDPHHWYANYSESGGRVVGEVCHFLDYFCFLFAAKPTRISAQSIRPVTGALPFPDSIAAQIEFADRSCGQLIYSAEGDPAFPKETLTVFASGFVAELTNFQRLILYSNRRRRKLSYSSKGHAEQMGAWLAFLSGEAEHPLPYNQSRTSTFLTFAALESIRRGCAVDPTAPFLLDPPASSS
ncbi:MAG: bi-domain-containing oxidoreductase [Candidatus Rokubacteria bacterium]|nr:bi-domain-containing oxidoreductase [Candidatus Rokubacteria bacterium]